MPIIHKLIQGYKLWHEILPHISKTARYTLGSRIDNLFLETVEFILMAAGSDARGKITYLRNASDKLDLLKFFVQVAWEMKVLPNKKFILISENLNEIGKMLGGWIKQTQ